MEPIEQDGATVYVTIKNQAGWKNGGMMPLSEQPGDASSFWIPYFTVPSCDEAVAGVKDLGGGVLEYGGRGPRKTAVVSNPQGAVFAVFEGETDE